MALSDRDMSKMDLCLIEKTVRKIVNDSDVNTTTKRMVYTEYMKLNGLSTLTKVEKQAVSNVIKCIIAELAQIYIHSAPPPASNVNTCQTFAPREEMIVNYCGQNLLKENQVLMKGCLPEYERQVSWGTNAESNNETSEQRPDVFEGGGSAEESGETAEQRLNVCEDGGSPEEACEQKPNICENGRIAEKSKPSFVVSCGQLDHLNATTVKSKSFNTGLKQTECSYTAADKNVHMSVKSSNFSAVAEKSFVLNNVPDRNLCENLKVFSESETRAAVQNQSSFSDHKTGPAVNNSNFMISNQKSEMDAPHKKCQKSIDLPNQRSEEVLDLTLEDNMSEKAESPEQNRTSFDHYQVSESSSSEETFHQMEQTCLERNTRACSITGSDSGDKSMRPVWPNASTGENSESDTNRSVSQKFISFIIGRECLKPQFSDAKADIQSKSVANSKFGHHLKSSEIELSKKEYDDGNESMVKLKMQKPLTKMSYSSSAQRRQMSSISKTHRNVSSLGKLSSVFNGTTEKCEGDLYLPTNGSSYKKKSAAIKVVDLTNDPTIQEIKDVAKNSQDILEYLEKKISNEIHGRKRRKSSGQLSVQPVKKARNSSGKLSVQLPEKRRNFLQQMSVQPSAKERDSVTELSAQPPEKGKNCEKLPSQLLSGSPSKRQEEMFPKGEKVAVDLSEKADSVHMKQFEIGSKKLQVIVQRLPSSVIYGEKVNISGDDNGLPSSVTCGEKTSISGDNSSLPSPVIYREEANISDDDSTLPTSGIYQETADISGYSSSSSSDLENLASYFANEKKRKK